MLFSYSAQDEDDDIIGFEWDVDNGATVAFEFNTSISEDLAAATGFRQHACRLLYESKERESSSDIPDEELEDFCM